MHHITVELENRLPFFARDIIANNKNLSDDLRESFYHNPDAIDEHNPNWHQWGIITHSEAFQEMFEREVIPYLKKWGQYDKVNHHLSKTIDGISKWNLFDMASPLHDLGKFDKGFKVMEDGSVAFKFGGHEARSEEIIREDWMHTLLTELGLTDSQIDYIARLAGLHFELGIIRNKAKKTEMGYTMAYARSEFFLNAVVEELPKYYGFEVEVGLLFLTDSLAKTDVFLHAEDDEEIEMKSSKAMGEILQRGLNRRLINAVKQNPVNTEITRNYLELIL